MTHPEPIAMTRPASSGPHHDRFGPFSVRWAYRKAELYPIRGRWVDDRGGADGLAALCIAKGCKAQEFDQPSLDWVAWWLGVNRDYARGFMIGWESRVLRDRDRDRAFRLGWFDGAAAAEAMGLPDLQGEIDLG